MICTTTQKGSRRDVCIDRGKLRMLLNDTVQNKKGTKALGSVGSCEPGVQCTIYRLCILGVEVSVC